MKLIKPFKIMDPLYGKIEFSNEINLLLWFTPIQRLRHIRLSNIESLEMPGIANISRFEHAIGVYFLTTKVSLASKLTPEQSLVLQAAALLHDWNITPFGHLFEEALYYLSENYDHEKKMDDLQSCVDQQEIGGINRQLLYGRETKIEQWGTKVFGKNWKNSIKEISATISGKGKLGKCISSSIDLDNIDNVFRIAYHMGLSVERNIPQRIAEGMVDYRNNEVIFLPETIGLLQKWLDLRREVYTYLMSSRTDFSGKAMLIQSIVWAYKFGIIDRSDWYLTDHSLISRLLKCKKKEITETIERWLTGELWELSDLFWMSGLAPDYKDVLRFGYLVSKEMGRECFTYRIKDKRTRELNILVSDGRRLKLGNQATKWLLGLVSSKRKSFSLKENKRISMMACDFFKTTYLGNSTDNINQKSLTFVKECN